MRSSFTAVALALGIVTMTALPAMALTLKENPFDEVGAQAPDDGVLAPGSETMGVLIENKGDPTAARSGPAGALPDTSAAMGVVIEYKPAEFNPGAQTAVESKSGGQVPGSETGIIGDLPAPVSAAIAIPNLLRARAAANEASALSTDQLDIDKALLGESLGLGAGLPTATQGPIHASNAKMEAMSMRELLNSPTDGQRPADYVPTGVELGELKLTIPTTDLAPSIKPTQGIQGRKAAPIGSIKTLQ